MHGGHDLQLRVIDDNSSGDRFAVVHQRQPFARLPRVRGCSQRSLTSGSLTLSSTRLVHAAAVGADAQRDGMSGRVDILRAGHQDELRSWPAPSWNGALRAFATKPTSMRGSSLAALEAHRQRLLAVFRTRWNFWS